MRDADDTAIVTAAWLIAGGVHIGPRREGLAVRGRRSRVVLTPDRLASSRVAMRRPDRARASSNRKATGATVHRSPRRARRTPLKPSAQGRPGDRRDLTSIPCAILLCTDSGASRHPAFPAPFGHHGARDGSKTRAKPAAGSWRHVLHHAHRHRPASAQLRTRTGRSSIRETVDRTDKPRRTGFPACAGNDSIVGEAATAHSSLRATLSARIAAR